MESYADSPPGSRENDSDNGSHHHAPISDEVSHAAAAAVVAPTSRVKLMISYGGRIQPRPHDNQLAYVNGETKILSIDRSMRFTDFHSKLASIVGADEICVKYQLPGEDLDALVSVTNDEDIEHMVMEYDRLHLYRSSNSSSSSTSSRSTPRVRVFLFPINPPPPSPALLEPKQERHWFVDTLSSIPPLHPQVTVPPPACNGQGSPDFLFGLDNTFVPPPAVKVKDPAPPVQPVPHGGATIEIPVKDDRQMGSDPSPNGSQVEIQRQIQELEKLQLADSQHQQQPQSLPQVQIQPQMQPQPVVTTMPKSGSDESLTRAAILPKTQDKPSVPVPAPAPAPAPVQLVQQPTPQAPPATAVPQPTMTAPNGYIPRFQSIAGGDHQPVYVISHAPQGYFAAAPPGAASFMYAMAP